MLNNPQQNRFWYLYAKKMSQEASPEEISELEGLMRLYPDWQYSAQHIQDIWSLTIKEPHQASHDAFIRHLNRLKRIGIDVSELEDEDAGLLIDDSKFSNRRRKIKFLAIAAGCMLMVTAFILLLSRNWQNSPLSPQKTEVSTRPGSKSKLSLPDGSTVWLNAGSILTYNKSFGITERDVTLEGEAFFDVVHVPEIPFVIQTHSIQVKVIGTAFNIKSYINERTTEASVIRGIVEIIPNNRPSEKFVLKPKEKLVITNEPDQQKASINTSINNRKEPMVALRPLTYFHKDSSVIETSWVDNKLVFDDETFGDLARKMERWYDIKINFENRGVEQLHLTGSFENETIQQALDALQITVNFKYEINQNKVTITR